MSMCFSAILRRICDFKLITNELELFHFAIKDYAIDKKLRNKKSFTHWVAPLRKTLCLLLDYILFIYFCTFHQYLLFGFGIQRTPVKLLYKSRRTVIFCLKPLFIQFT